MDTAKLATDSTDEEALSQQKIPALLQPPELFVVIRSDASFKVGTCEHCVLLEEGRPVRSWDAQGDAELDFDRDTYFAKLARLGISMHDCQAYVCP